MALLAAAAWSVRALTVTVFVSVMLTIVYYSNGEDALYNWPYLAAWALVAALAAVSLRRTDPLRLAAGARQRPRAQAASDGPVPAGAERGAG
jgi:alpha-1,6-mannosyltransferase